VEHYPPRTIEFDEAFARLNGKGRNTRPRASSVNDHYRPNITYNFAPGPQSGSNIMSGDQIQRARGYSNPLAYSPSKPRAAKQNCQQNIIELLSRNGYNPEDYTRQALYDYLVWLTANLPGEYLEFFDEISVSEIGVDMFDQVTMESAFQDILLECPNVPRAAARRITSNCRQWLLSDVAIIHTPRRERSKLPFNCELSQVYPILTLQCRN